MAVSLYLLALHLQAYVDHTYLSLTALQIIYHRCCAISSVTSELTVLQTPEHDIRGDDGSPDCEP